MSDLHDISDIQIIRVYLGTGTQALRNAQLSMERHGDESGTERLNEVFKVLAELEGNAIVYQNTKAAQIMITLLHSGIKNAHKLA